MRSRAERDRSAVTALHCRDAKKIIPTSDPVGYLQEPTISDSCSSSQRFNGGSANSLTAGCYLGLSWQGSGSLNLGSGLYVIDGNLSLIGSGAVTGSNVTFYITGKTSVIPLLST